jgi:DHA2 family multidrug resistance protein
MTEATAMYNLLRNIGGSFGVAFVTTVLSRRAQMHQFRLVEHLTPFDSTYQFVKEKIHMVLKFVGIHNIPPDALIYRELLRQSHMLAFNDAFYLLSLMMVLILPLILIMKRAKQSISIMGH